MRPKIYGVRSMPSGHRPNRFSPEQNARLWEKPGINAASAQTIMGWVFFPSAIHYEDGSIWRPQSEGECFNVIWRRDPEHPDMPSLPPRQIELNPD